MENLIAPQLAGWGACAAWAPLHLLSLRKEVGQDWRQYLNPRVVYQGALPLFVGTSFYGLIVVASKQTERLVHSPTAAAAITGAWTPLIYNPLRSYALAKQQNLYIQPYTGALAFSMRNAAFAPLMLVMPNVLEPTLGLGAFPLAAAMATLITMPLDVLISRKMVTGKSYPELIRQFSTSQRGPFQGWGFRLAATTVEFYLFNSLSKWFGQRLQ